MSYKISKELFEAVVGFKVIEFYCKNEIQYYPADRERVRCIDWIPTLSGYEYNDLFFKSKEWAYNQGYVIFSSQQKTGWAVFIQTDRDGIIASFEGIEQQACFDACQWILDKDKQ